MSARDAAERAFSANYPMVASTNIDGFDIIAAFQGVNMNDVYAGAISVSNEAALILAAGSFALTLLAMLLTVGGVRSAAKANEHAKELDYLREKRKEGIALLKTTTGGADAYVDGVDGRKFLDSQMILSASLLVDHPELISSIKAARRYLDSRNDKWERVRQEMDNTIRLIEQSR